MARIIAAIAPRQSDHIVEIGGGLGALTLPLAERVESLDVLEVDERLAEWLDRSEAGGRTIIHRADALDFDFASLAREPASLRVVGNLPYNVSTPLLFRLLAFRTCIDDMHLMLQKEVVDRMTASPGTKQYGRLTVMLSPWLEVESCFDIGPGAFEPPPKVWSSLARLGVRREPRFETGDEVEFARLVAHLFSMRRKTLARSLRGRLSGSAIEALDIDPRARPETLLPAEFAKLAGAVRRQASSA